MNRIVFIFIFLLTISARAGLHGVVSNESESILSNITKQDTLKGNQILHNGRLWRNLYYGVKEDQFLFSKEFLPGSLTINGKTFKNLSIRYDIYNDEIMTPTNQGAILQLNKEMVDSFTIIFENKTYKFTKIQEDSLKGIKGYVNVLYKGKSALYIKYRKEIDLLAVDGKYDIFFQTHRIYFLKDANIHPITDKSDLFKVLYEDKAQIRNFIKKNKLKVSKKIPESFVPVIAYFDSMSQ